MNSETINFPIPLISRIVVLLISATFFIVSILFFYRSAQLFAVGFLILALFFFIGSFGTTQIFINIDTASFVVRKKLLFIKIDKEFSRENIKLYTEKVILTVDNTSGTEVAVIAEDTKGRKYKIKQYENEIQARELIDTLLRK